MLIFELSCFKFFLVVIFIKPKILNFWRPLNFQNEIFWLIKEQCAVVSHDRPLWVQQDFNNILIEPFSHCIHIFMMLHKHLWFLKANLYFFHCFPFLPLLWFNYFCFFIYVTLFIFLYFLFSLPHQLPTNEMCGITKKIGQSIFVW